jgi:hypothetical protein
MSSSTLFLDRHFYSFLFLSLPIRLSRIYPFSFSYARLLEKEEEEKKIVRVLTTKRERKKEGI